MNNTSSSSATGFEQVFNRIGKKAKEVRLVVGGITGNGKSSLLNLVMNSPAGTNNEIFKEYDTSSSGTSLPQIDMISYYGVTIKATDNPGFLDSRGNETDQLQLRKVVENNKNTSYHAILYCIPLEKKLDLSEQAVLDILRTVYGPDTFKYVIFCFTKADQVDVTKRNLKHSSMVNELKKVLQVPEILAVTVSKNDCNSILQLYQQIATLIELRPEAFTPPQVEEKFIREVCNKAAKKFKINEKDLFAAIVTLVPVFASGRCTIL